MNRYKYRAINNKGRTVRGSMAAASENDLHNELQSVNLELVQCKPVGEGSFLSNFRFFKEKVKTRDLLQLFIQLEQMQSAGVTLLDALSDARDSADNGTIRDIMSEIYRNVSEGVSLSEAMAHHPKVFSTLFISLIAAGEESGNMVMSYRQLIDYLRWLDSMQSKVRKATRYPIMLLVVVLGVVVTMMAYVVPQIVGFIENMDQELPGYTIALMATSEFFQDYWFYVLLTPFILAGLYKFLRTSSSGFAYFMDSLFLKMPVIGGVIRKISIARYAQTFGALYKSGIDVLKCLSASSKTVSNLVLLEALEHVRENVQNGNALSDAFARSGEFPGMVVRMIKVGEESGNMSDVLKQVSDFYTADVDESVQGLIAMIEPLLTAIMGGMILWMAVSIFGPIYNSFETLDM